MALTTIASFRETHSAHIARAKLEAAGIPAFVADEHLVGVQWFYSDAIGGVKIQVPDSFAEEAREIVAADLSAGVAAAGRSQRARRRIGAQTCPRCGGELGAAKAVSREVGSGRRRFVLWSQRATCDDCARRG
jgi:hypothetical protein